MSKRPWERLPDESLKAYEVFREYLEAGPGRRLSGGNTPGTEGHQGLGKSAPKIDAQKKLSGRFQWVKRAAAYDEWIEGEYSRARELAIKDSAKRWAAREEDLREKAYIAAELALEVAGKMLTIPLADREPKPGGAGGFIVTPNKRWAMHTAAKLMMAAWTLGHAAIRNDGAIFDELDDLFPASRLQ